MTRVEIIRMARESGWNGIYAKPLFSIKMQEDDFLCFAALVAASEREACAQIADEWATSEQKQFGNGGPGAAIRARGEK